MLRPVRRGDRCLPGGGPVRAAPSLGVLVVADLPGRLQCRAEQIGRQVRGQFAQRHRPGFVVADRLGRLQCFGQYGGAIGVWQVGGQCAERLRPGLVVADRLGRLQCLAEQICRQVQGQCTQRRRPVPVATDRLGRLQCRAEQIGRQVRGQCAERLRPGPVFADRLGRLQCFGQQSWTGKSTKRRKLDGINGSTGMKKEFLRSTRNVTQIV